MALSSQQNLFLQVSFTKQNALRIQRSPHEQLKICIVPKERIFQSIHTDFKLKMTTVNDHSEKIDFIVCMLTY